METNNKWVDPTAIGIFIVAGILLGGFWPMLEGYVTPAAAPLIGTTVLASAIVFVILMVIEIRNGHFFGALMNGVFGVLLGLVPGMVFMTQFLAGGMGLSVDLRIIGWYFLYVGIVLLIVGFICGKFFWHMAIAFWVLAVDVFLLGLVFAGYLSSDWEPAIGWVIFAGGIYFLFMASAAALGTVFQRPVLPTGGPMFK